MLHVGLPVTIAHMWSSVRDADPTDRRSGDEEGRRAVRTALEALLAVAIGVGLVVNVPTADAGGLTSAGREPEVSSASTGLSGTGSSEASLSGTIIDGLFTTGYAMGCLGTPDCTAWVAAGCPAHLAGIDPAGHTSIVSVATRAGTSRVFEVRRGTGESILLGGVKVQFWTKDCTELHPSWHSVYDCHGACSSEARTIDGISIGREWTRTTLSIPARAAWMTVSANDNLNIRWTLR